MNTDCTDETASYYFDTANYLLGDIVSNQEANQDVQLGALIMSVYMPAFRKRVEGCSVTRNDCEQIYDSIGAALHYLRPLHTDEPPQWRMVEAATLALSARTRQPDLLLYPASPREEQSSNQRLNHDSYFFTGTDKLPIQQKLLPTQKVYDECITILTIDPIIDRALRRCRDGSDMSVADKVNYLLSLIVAETGGVELARHEEVFLNFITQAIASHHVELSGRGEMLRTA
jgi:hypothetical protein